VDIHWVRPESKTRIIRVEQIRELNHEINLKPTEARYKVGIIVAADRLKTEAANAFLKTLEEPPPQSMLLLLTTEPQRILETLLSRCLRLNFGGAGPRPLEPAQLQWLGSFSEMAAGEHKSLLNRYRLLDVLLSKLNEMKGGIEQSLTARSPLQAYKEAEKDLLDKWEDELAAAIEAEYRRQRSDLLGTVQWWLRDVWLETLNLAASATGSAGTNGAFLNFPQLRGTQAVAKRLSPKEAQDNLQVLEQLQRWLGTNVQEALALEVGLLKLRL
jgi:DNA polymerase-3 subunit delta'